MPSIIKKAEFVPFIVFLFMLSLIAGCKNAKKSPPPAQDIAANTEELGKKVKEIIQYSLEFALGNEGAIDSIHQYVLVNDSLVQQVYVKRQFAPMWSDKQQWKPLGDSLLNFIAQAKLYGLFPEDYHFGALDTIQRQFINDSLSRSAKRDAVLWANADVLLTDAFMHIVKDIKLGRLPADSVTLRADSILTDEFYINRLALVEKHNSLSLVFHALEPGHKGYEDLKQAIPAFLANADYREFTIVPSPKSNQVEFKRLLQKRLFEAGF
ncbi:MAG: hypothetical protein ABIR18_08730, partial [Chitinophagaceae bacterium]